MAAIRLPSCSSSTILLRFQTLKPPPTCKSNLSPNFLSLTPLINQSTIIIRRRDLHCALIKATQDGKKENLTTTNQSDDNEETLETVSSDQLGAEIKETMKNIKERDDKVEGGGGGGGDFWSGVADEIKEIEWPVFGKVLGTTGVVLGVIAGSSVVLLTVNAVLAELSDQVFAGKGVQDFFG